MAAAIAATACSGGAPSPEADAGQTPDEAGASVEGVSGRAPRGVGGVPSVVMLRPTDDVTGAAAPERGDGVIDQFGLSFSPALLVVDAGSSVEFRNSEAALSHNVSVRARTGGPTLIDEDSPPGEALLVTIEQPGGYDVLCDMHPGMAAFIFASDAPWTVYADEDGSFELGVVPAGTYTIQLWTADAGFLPEQPLTVADGRIDIDLRPSG